MENGICKQVAARPEIRSSFFHLAQKVFGLSFEGWYEAGYWSESYQPYAWVEEGRVVANVSVNRIDLTWQGEPRRYIQLGTVMADPQYRGRGHARRLMETVLEEWRGRCDALYLFANRTVLDFYPKFQFVRAAERQYTLPLRPCARGCRRLDMKREEDRAALLAHYRRSNPYSAFPMVGNGGLLMFYCTGPFQDCVYLMEELDAVILMQREGPVLHVFDIYGGGDVPLQEALSAAASGPVRQACLGFTPKEPGNAAVSKREDDDDALFLLAGKENLFERYPLMFPILSHA